MANLVRKYVSNLPNFTSLVFSSRFGKVAYYIRIPCNVDAGAQYIGVSEIIDAKPTTVRFDPAGPPAAGNNYFNAYNVPMRMIAYPAGGGAPEPIPACRLNAATREQYMVTATLTGCTVAIFASGADLDVCHVRPDEKHRGVTLANAIATGTLTILDETGVALPPANLVAMLTASDTPGFTRPSSGVLGPPNCRVAKYDLNNQFGTLIGYKRKGRWTFLVQASKPEGIPARKWVGASLLYRCP